MSTASCSPANRSSGRSAGRPRFISARRPLTIWLLSPYHTGSHAAWAQGYAAHSRHRVQILAMDGQFWKWRVQGGALELTTQARARLAHGERPDVLLATSMVNLPALWALLRHEAGFPQIPAVVYMHENQLTYPPPPGTKRDLTYGMVQHLSMLAADRVCFNSAYHLDSWYGELPRLLKHFPDYTHLETVSATRQRAQVLPVGCDLGRLDRYRPIGSMEDPCPTPSDSGPEGVASATPGAPHPAPLVLWNQRWEYDKDPATMLQALYALADEGRSFRVALAGENFRVMPAEFAEARWRLGDRLVHYGYAADEADYARLLWEADVVLSTAIHEFFGVSVVEAMYCGCWPVLPRRLSYPELIPPEYHDQCLYDSFDGLLERLRAALTGAGRLPGLRAAAAHFDWGVQAPQYDALLEEVWRARPTGGSSGLCPDGIMNELP